MTLFSNQRRIQPQQSEQFHIDCGKFILCNAIELGYRCIAVSIRNILAKGILHLFKEREETVGLDNLIKGVHTKCRIISLKYDLIERVKT